MFSFSLGGFVCFVGVFCLFRELGVCVDVCNLRYYILLYVVLLMFVIYVVVSFVSMWVVSFFASMFGVSFVLFVVVYIDV